MAGRLWLVEPPPLCTQQSFADFSVAVDLVLLAAEDHRASQNATGHGVAVLQEAGARAAEALTHMGDGGCAGRDSAAGPSPAAGASSARLLVVELQVLQALCQGQLLLDGHPQQRVECLLLILCRSQLPLHVIQLGDILITAAREKKQRFKNKPPEGAISSLQ